jgi:hypothetical protein
MPARSRAPAGLGAAAKWTCYSVTGPDLEATVENLIEGAFTGMGAGGQFITVLPGLDMVIAHKTDTGQTSAHGQRNRSVSGAEYDSILRMIIAARCPNGKCQ